MDDVLMRLQLLFRQKGVHVDSVLTYRLHRALKAQLENSVFPGAHLLVRASSSFNLDDYRAFCQSGLKVLSCAGATARLFIPPSKFSLGVLERLVALPAICQIKVAQPVRPATITAGQRGAPAIANKASPPLAGAPPHLDGNNIVVGVVDYGCDLLHPALRSRRSGATRLLALWDQRGRSRPPGDLANPAFDVAVFNYGRELAADEINAALETYEVDRDRAAFYQMTCDPHANYYDPAALEEGCHGTQMASIAAGSRMAGPDGEFQGVAPGSDIIFVNLGIDTEDWKNRSLSEDSKEFGDNACLADAVKYVVCKAMRLREEGHRVDGIVVNLSLGTWAGAHDGKSIVERTIDEVVSVIDGKARRAAQDGTECDWPMISVVVAAGNAALLDGHGEGRARPGETAQVRWLVDPAGKALVELDLWYRAAGSPSVRIVAPSALGDCAVEVAAGETRFIEIGGSEVAVATHVPAGGDRPGQVELVVDPSRLPPVKAHLASEVAEATGWTVELVQASDAEDTLVYHCWIEREIGYGTGSRLAASRMTSTLGSITCGEHPVVVGAYDPAEPGRPDGTRSPFWPSSNGPCPWTTATPLTPHLCAPGQGILCAKSRSGDLTAAPSGSSLAAAHVTGGIALLMQAARQSGRRLSAAEIREGLVEGAKRRRLEAGGRPDRIWDPAQGYGPFDVSATLTVLSERAIH